MGQQIVLPVSEKGIQHHSAVVVIRSCITVIFIEELR